MAFVFTPPPATKDTCPAPPLKADGSRWELGIRLPNGDIAWADDTPTLVGLLIGDVRGYLAADEQERCFKRIMASVGFQVRLQARINFTAQTVLMHWEKCAQWERDILNGSRHIQPSNFPSREFYEGRDVWAAPVPLVVVSTGYAPVYGDVEIPYGVDGAVWEIDGETDESLLDTLSESPVSLIDVWLRAW